MIKILEVRTIEKNGSPSVRHAEIIISSGPEAYRWRVGGLPLTGDLQTILDAREAELFTLAQAAGEAVSDETTAQVSARDWYEAHPNAALLFELSIDDLEAEIDGLDLSPLPAATQAKLRLMFNTWSLAVRVLARREGLI